MHGYSRLVSLNPQATRQALLQAAVVEFAAYGLAGARVDRIAREAGVNKERVYGHFGSKRLLFAAVLSSELARLAEAVPFVPERRDALADYAGRVFDHHLAHPHVLRLLYWEGLEDPGPPVIDEDQRAALYDAKVAVLQQARAGHGCDDDTPAGMLLYGALALVAWWFAVPQVARMILGPLAEDRDAQRAAIMELVARLGRPTPDVQIAPEPPM